MEQARQKRLDFLMDLLFWAAVGGIAIFCYRYLLGWLLPLLFGCGAAALAHGAARRLARGRWAGSGRAACLLLAGAYGLAVLLLVLLGALAAQRLGRIIALLPGWYADVLLPGARMLDDKLDLVLARLLPGLTGSALLQGLAGEAQSRVTGLLAWAVRRLGAAGVGTADLLANCLLGMACSMLIAGRYREIAGFVQRQLPPKAAELLRGLGRETAAALSGLMRRTLLIQLCVTLELAAGFRLLGIEGWLMAAVTIALLDLLPLVGLASAMLPWAAVSFLSGRPPQAAGLLILWGVAVISHSMLELKFTGSQLGLHPLAAVCAVLLGYRLAGVWGMLLLPVAAALLGELRRAGLIRFWK